jgi:hypothetical protein
MALITEIFGARSANGRKLAHDFKSVTLHNDTSENVHFKEVVQT